MNDFNDYLMYYTVSKLSSDDVLSFSTSKITVIDLMKEMEQYVNTIRNLEQKLTTIEKDLIHLKEMEKRLAVLENTKIDIPVKNLFDHIPEVGGSLHFGTYGENPIEWIILDMKENKMLLLSKYIIENKEYHSQQKNIYWETCDLRNWLNTDFIIKAFSEEEKSMIFDTQLVNNKNQQYGTGGGSNTIDKVFLLSIEDVEMYLKSKLNRKTYSLDNKNNIYCLRTPGAYRSNVAYVDEKGYILGFGEYVSNKFGVRPALWVEVK